MGAIHAGASAAFGIGGSTNWSGWYAPAGGGNNFTDVSATWTVPTLKAPASGTSYCATRIGFDGVTNTTVEQCGIDESITSGGATNYFAWYEFAPAGAVNVGLIISPGDIINADVTYEPGLSSPGNFAYLFSIQDGGQSFSQTEFTTSNDARSTAEWIVEAPTVGGSQSTLASFSKRNLLQRRRRSQRRKQFWPSAPWSNPAAFEMFASKTGPVIAYPSNVNADSEAYTDYFASGLPSLTWKGTSTNKSWDPVSTVWNTSANTVAYGDGCAVTFNDSNGGATDYSVTLSTTLLPGSVTVNNSSNNYTITGGGSIAGSGSLTKSGADALTLNTVNAYTGGTNVNAGKLLINATGVFPPALSASPAEPPTQPATGGETITSLSISGAGKFDVNNNHLFINYLGGADPISSIARSWSADTLRGAWNGNGIMSTAAAANSGSYGLGYADSADAGNPAGLAANTIEIKYTLLGDANLDGVVNGIDFGILAANFNKSVSRWDQGDFDYNNIVNGIDFAKLAANFNKGASGAATDVAALNAFAAANGLLADVPEPATLGLLTIAAAGVLRRRSRKSDVRPDSPQ